MKKVALKNVNLTGFSDFIGTLIPLTEASTIYFIIDQERIYTDSHNDSGTIIKSISKDINKITEKHNVTEKIKLCFYDGKRLLKAFSFLNGNTVDCVIGYTEVDGENFAQVLKIVGSKITITLDAADPSLIEFANVPEESIAEVKGTNNADCSFNTSRSELIQVQKLCEFGNKSEITINVNGKVKVGTELTLTFPDIQKTISNKISVLGNVINPLSRSFFIESKLPVDNNFRPNLLAQVKIKDYEKKNAISIPVNLLQNDEKGKFVYVAVTEAGKLVARKKVVTTGEFYSNNIEVLSGLAAGEILITEGFQSIYDGQLITKTIQ